VSITEPQATEIFLLRRMGLFAYVRFGSSGLEVLGSVNLFPLKTGFRYIQFPFKACSTAFDKANAIPRHLLNRNQCLPGRDVM
jgi:hypothetical protein